jgi:hypothetical protein
MDMLIFLRCVRKLRKRTWYGLKSIASLSDAAHASRVAKSMMRSERMLWKFLEDPLTIPLTNNHVERQLNHT